MSANSVHRFGAVDLRAYDTDTYAGRAYVAPEATPARVDNPPRIETQAPINSSANTRTQSTPYRATLSAPAEASWMTRVATAMPDKAALLRWGPQVARFGVALNPFALATVTVASAAMGYWIRHQNAFMPTRTPDRVKEEYLMRPQERPSHESGRPDRLPGVLNLPIGGKAATDLGPEWAQPLSTPAAPRPSQPAPGFERYEQPADAWLHRADDASGDDNGTPNPYGLPKWLNEPMSQNPELTMLTTVSQVARPSDVRLTGLHELKGLDQALASARPIQIEDEISVHDLAGHEHLRYYTYEPVVLHNGIALAPLSTHDLAFNHMGLRVLYQPTSGYAQMLLNTVPYTEHNVRAVLGDADDMASAWLDLMEASGQTVRDIDVRLAALQSDGGAARFMSALKSSGEMAATKGIDAALTHTQERFKNVDGIRALLKAEFKVTGIRHDPKLNENWLQLSRP